MDWKTRVLKRAIDVAGASVGLALTAPLFPLVATAVRLTSKGPILFKQTRCGAERRSGIAPSRPPSYERRGAGGYHTFEMYKFRTMRVDAEKDTGPVLASKNDPRTTPIGAILRKTRLDELPQLIHILTGEMSLVGPRPERPEMMAELAKEIPFFEERMRLVKPGLTGLAQIYLNYDGTLDQSNHIGLGLQTYLRKKYKSDSDTPASDTPANGTPTNGAAGNSTPANGASVSPTPANGTPPTGRPDTRAFGNKLLFDLAYSAILENHNPLATLKTDIEIMVKTPLVMLKARGQ